MKRHFLIAFIYTLLLSSCMKDKGNYTYVDLGEITVENVAEEMELLGFIDHIVIDPKITSTIDGEIKPDNKNYTIKYKLGYKGMGSMGGVVDGKRQVWLDITPENGFKIDIPADYTPNKYVCWMTITDNRNNNVVSKFFDINISSTTYEGWLVLGNEGTEERARLDMISLLSSTRTEPIYDIAKGMPTIYQATQLGFHTAQSNPGDEISIFSKTGAYKLSNSTLESSELSEFKVNSFVTPPTEHILAQYSMSITGDAAWRTRHSFVFSDNGNLYVQGHGEAGSAYGLPINTLQAGTPAQFKVAPFAGINPTRPANTLFALFYDSDNKRFVGFNSNSSGALFALSDPQNSLFSFNTGKDMVYMEGTRRANGLVYAILEKNNQRSIYGINMAGTGFVQEEYIDVVNAPNFNQAKLFAFHSQFPYLFYAVNNKVYLYNLGTKTTTELTNLNFASTEEITCLKFNLFRNSHLTSLNKQTDEFLSQQFQLIVGTYDSSKSGVNNGKVGFYKVDGINNTLSKFKEYSGFAKVKDVVYRERSQ